MVSRNRHVAPRAFTALVFVLLLTSGECSRIRLRTSFAGTPSRNIAEASPVAVGSHLEVAASSEDSEASNATVAWPPIWGGNEVCRKKDLARDAKAVNRYHYKMDKLRSLVVKLSDQKCDKGCVAKWLELKNRMLHFESCARFLQADEDGSGVAVPQALKEVMLSGDDALGKGLLEPLDMVSSLLERKHIFPIFDDLAQCSFNPTRLTFDRVAGSTEPEDTVREQLFGSDCDAAAAKQYVERLKGTPRKIAEAMVNQISQIIQIAQKEQPDDVQKDVEDMTTKLKEQLVMSQQMEATAFDKSATSLAAASEDADDLDNADGALLQLEELTEEVAGGAEEVMLYIVGFFCCLLILAFLIAFISNGGLAGVGAIIAAPFHGIWWAGSAAGSWLAGILR